MAGCGLPFVYGAVQMSTGGAYACHRQSESSYKEQWLAISRKPLGDMVGPLGLEPRTKGL
jgi:hypothetical protein